MIKKQTMALLAAFGLSATGGLGRISRKADHLGVPEQCRGRNPYPLP